MMMKYIPSIFICITLSLLSCTPNLNGRMVGGLYEKGIKTIEGKELPISGYTDENAAVFYLVRHAEKASGRDPELTEAGTERAKKLGMMLEDVKLSTIYSTNTKRTIYTAAPTAEVHKMEVDSYDAKKQEEFVEQIIGRKGEHFLIVGHSNSIPNLLNLFQEKKVYDHIDESVYDNFYIVIASSKEDVKVIALKY